MEEPHEILDTQHAYSVSTHTDCSSTLVVPALYNVHSRYQTGNYVEDTTCVRLDS